MDVMNGKIIGVMEDRFDRPVGIKIKKGKKHYWLVIEKVERCEL